MAAPRRRVNRFFAAYPALTCRAVCRSSRAGRGESGTHVRGKDWGQSPELQIPRLRINFALRRGCSARNDNNEVWLRRIGARWSGFVTRSRHRGAGLQYVDPLELCRRALWLGDFARSRTAGLSTARWSLAERSRIGRDDKVV